MTDRRAAPGPCEASAPGERFGVLASIEEEWFALEILVGTRGSMVLRADRDELPLPRETAAVLIEALAAARLWSSLELELGEPIDVARRVESVALDDASAEQAPGLREGEAFGVFATDKGPEALIWLVLRDAETQLHRGMVESMIANLTSAWLWLWGGAA